MTPRSLPLSLTLALALVAIACSAPERPAEPAPCGNGKLDTGELCDPAIAAGSPGACPTSCDDADACTTDAPTGTASACTATCTHTAVTKCTAGDGCCAPGCNHNSDADCSASCGNAITEAGETCDGNCPTQCNDGNACTSDHLTGDAANCTAKCAFDPVVECVNGDGCCPAACNHNNDSDCSARCGNGTVEPGETCDGDCPTSCDDQNACTTDLPTGSAANCNFACTHNPINSCKGGDGCCPAGCTHATDEDCSATCGDHNVDPGETCDGNCPTSCNDGNACTIDSLVGSAAACSAQCTTTPVTACQSGDGCCPAGCTQLNDNDCQPKCGNSAVETGELCDGNCPTTCDDGNVCTTDQLAGTGCQAHCTATPITACNAATSDGCCPPGCTQATDKDCAPRCGNGVVENGELCDGACPAACNDANACTKDALTGSAATCNAVCTYTAVTSCTSGDGCCPAGCHHNNDSDCSPTCGNGVIEAGETCDGNCPTACDDKNACTKDVLTGSAATCNAACSNTPISQCVTGDGCCPAGCNKNSDNDCSATCGNGVVEPGETCDGNCPSTCSDNNACTKDTLVGSATTCSAQCAHQAITQCVSGDGCCAAGCTATTDSDCAATGRVGDACTSGGMCVSSACIDQQRFGWPGGYCSLTCSANADCGTGAHCGLKDANGQGVCLRNCTTGTDCGRAGAYDCTDDDRDATKECMPVASGTGAVGAACTTATDCAGGVAGYCVTPDRGWKNGYCTRTCYADNSLTCPSGSHCGFIDTATGRGACVADCTQDTQCRADGYRCWDADTDAKKECIIAATGTGQVGDPCNELFDCSGGQNGACIEQTQGWTGGYCTRTCTANGSLPCPAGSACGYLDGNGNGLCVKTCTANAGCRATGYQCYDGDGVTTDGSECLPAATGTGAVGAPCASRAECAGGRYGYCLAAADGYPDGYCTVQCAPGTGTCNAGSACVAFDPASTNSNFCAATCANTTQCRAGYTCKAPVTGAANTCWP